MMTTLRDDGTRNSKHSNRANHVVGDLRCRRVAFRPVDHFSLCTSGTGRNSYGSVACDPASRDRHICVLWGDASAARKR